MEIGGADTDKCSHRTGYITGRHQLYVTYNKRLSSRTAFVFYTKNIMNHKKFILINQEVFFFNYDENKEDGELIIGDYPHKYDTKNYNENNYKYLYAMQRNGIIRWDITFDNIYSKAKNFPINEKKQIGKVNTKQSASKILKLESQIEATNEKIKRAKK